MIKLSSRAERRREKQGVKDPVYNIKKSEIDRMVVEQVQTIREKMTEDIALRVSTMFLAYCFVVLHDQFGFGKKRLMRFREEIDKLADLINEDYVTNKDLVKLCEEEFKLDIDKVLKERWM